MTARLSSSIVSPASLAAPMRMEMFELFRRHYDDVGLDTFLRDLGEKEHVIVLRDRAGALRGFSTLRTYDLAVRGRAVRLLFSGDTIIDEGCWGEQELGRAWSELAGRIRAEDPARALYWLLLSKGYRTYLYLPFFFRDFRPRCGGETFGFEKAVADAFASAKYGGDYVASRGTVAFRRPPGRLRADLADVAPHHLRNEHVRFFLEANPGYRLGHELVCLARLDADNLRGFARNCFLRGEASAAVKEAAAG
jgi:hypothetical protein